MTDKSAENWHELSIPDTLANKAGFCADDLLQILPCVDAIPFESTCMYMATLHQQGEGNPPILYVEGSVESVLSRCETAVNADLQPLPHINRNRIIVGLMLIFSVYLDVYHDFAEKRRISPQRARRTQSSLWKNFSLCSL